MNAGAMQCVTNGSYLSLWEGCWAHEDIKPVGQYLQEAAAWHVAGFTCILTMHEPT